MPAIIYDTLLERNTLKVNTLINNSTGTITGTGELLLNAQKTEKTYSNGGVIANTIAMGVYNSGPTNVKVQWAIPYTDEAGILTHTTTLNSVQYTGVTYNYTVSLSSLNTIITYTRNTETNKCTLVRSNANKLKLLSLHNNISNTDVNVRNTLYYTNSAVINNVYSLTVWGGTTIPDGSPAFIEQNNLEEFTYDASSNMNIVVRFPLVVSEANNVLVYGFATLARKTVTDTSVVYGLNANITLTFVQGFTDNLVKPAIHITWDELQNSNSATSAYKIARLNLAEGELIANHTYNVSNIVNNSNTGYTVNATSLSNITSPKCTTAMLYFGRDEHTGVFTEEHEEQRKKAVIFSDILSNNELVLLSIENIQQTVFTNTVTNATSELSAPEITYIYSTVGGKNNLINSRDKKYFYYVGHPTLGSFDDDNSWVMCTTDYTDNIQNITNVIFIKPETTNSNTTVVLSPLEQNNVCILQNFKTNNNYIVVRTLNSNNTNIIDVCDSFKCYYVANDIVNNNIVAKVNIKNTEDNTDIIYKVKQTDPDTEKLHTPTILQVASTTETDCLINFSHVDQATAYRVQYSKNTLFDDDTVVEQRYITAGLKHLTNLEQNTRYCYRVMALGNGTNILDSDWTYYA